MSGDVKRLFLLLQLPVTTMTDLFLPKFVATFASGITVSKSHLTVNKPAWSSKALVAPHISTSIFLY
jgi:hypothetical protein